MRLFREARVGLLLACVPLSSIGCASLSPKLNILPSIALHRAETQYQAARDAEQRGNLEKARELYASLQRQSPNNADYAHRMGVVCTQLQDYVTAGKYFEHARKLDGRNPTLLADMGYSVYLQKDFASAESLLRESVAIRGDDTRAVNNLAMAVGFQGRYDESLAIFQRVNNQTQSLLNLAFIQAQRNEPESAMYTYRQILASEPGNKLATSALQLLHATHPKIFVPSPAAAVEVASSAAVPEVSIHPAWDGQPSVQPAPNRYEELPGTPAVTAASATPPAEFNAPVITPLDSKAPAAPEVANPVAEEKLVAARNEFELPDRVQPPSELPRDAEEAPAAQPEVAKPEVAKVDELADVLEGDDTAPEGKSGDMDELTELNWAKYDLAKQKSRNETESGLTSSSQQVPWLRGFCPVALRDERRLAITHEEFSAEHHGQTFRFSSADARDQFLAHPDWYVPAAGGLDIIEVRRGNSVTMGTLDHAVWFRHRLHLFSSAENLAAFRAAPRTFVSNP